MRHFNLSRAHSCPDLMDNRTPTRTRTRTRESENESSNSFRSHGSNHKNNHKNNKKNHRIQSSLSHNHHDKSNASLQLPPRRGTQKQTQTQHSTTDTNTDIPCNQTETPNHSRSRSGSSPSLTTACQRSNMRVQRLDDSLHRDGLAHSTSSMPHHVSFGSVTIRDYERSVGDNPSVTRGVPISLGWEFCQYQDIPLESYEASVVRRSKTELIMSPQDRFLILKQEWQIPQRDIANAVRQSLKTKNQRRQTVLRGDGNETWDRIRSSIKQSLLKWKANNKQQENHIHDFMNQCQDAMQVEDLDQTRHKGTLIPMDFLIELPHSSDEHNQQTPLGDEPTTPQTTLPILQIQIPTISTVEQTVTSSTGTEDHDEEEDSDDEDSDSDSDDEDSNSDNDSNDDDATTKDENVTTHSFPDKDTQNQKQWNNNNNHPRGRHHPQSTLLPNEEQAIAY